MIRFIGWLLGGLLVFVALRESFTFWQSECVLLGICAMICARPKGGAA